MERALPLFGRSNHLREVILSGRNSKKEVARDGELARKQVRVERQQHLRREPVSLGQRIDAGGRSHTNKANGLARVFRRGAEGGILVTLGAQEREKLSVVVSARESEA